MRSSFAIPTILLCAATASAAPTQTAPAKPAAEAPLRLHFDVKKGKLDNGLRVVMLVDHTSPTVAVDLVYDVGARNEERGKSGFAHLFEHMMFQGSLNVAKGEHMRLVTSHGGVLDATTGMDRTNYYEMLPSSELPLALWLEADRMKTLDISVKNLDNQRAVVKEEYRMRVENAAYVPSFNRLNELVYEGYWPYEHPGIGTMKDLDAAQIDWVKDFHAKYYAPNNAVLALAGDFEPDQAMELVKKYFASATPVSVPKFEPPPMPEQTAPRAAVVEDAHAKLPAFLYGWAIPKAADPDHHALAIATRILADGESSRLYRALVRERGLAVSVDAWTAGNHGPDALDVMARLAANAKVADAQKLVDSQLADLGRLGPSDEEMKKARARVESSFLFGLESNFARAGQLAEFEVFDGDANLINQELDKYLAVTKDDVKRVVTKYLTPARRNMVEVKPAAESK